MSKNRPVPRSTIAESTPESSAPFWTILMSSVAVIFGIYRAIELRWISDDAFITMRYVKNFLDGNGLVYNIGERVEGYTHFLWLLLLSAAGAIGIDPVDASIWLGIASYVAILALLLQISYKKQKGLKTAWLPIAAIIYALNYDTAEWASGGLETSFYALLILLVFWIWFYTSLEERRRLILTGVLLACIALTRPDGVLFTMSAVLLLIARAIYARKIASAAKPIALLLLPSILIGIPYLIWKYHYYGDILPLTYYVKSGGVGYVGQGLYYIGLFFRVNYAIAVALLGSVIVLSRAGLNQFKKHEEPSKELVAAFVSIVYLFGFVVKSGGDFMFARFIIPVVPFLLLVIEESIWKLPVTAAGKRFAVAVFVVVACFAQERISTTTVFQMGDGGKRVVDWDRVMIHHESRGIMDERWFYYDHITDDQGSRSVMAAYSDAGKFLEPLFRGLGATVAIPGAGNMIAYYANFRTAINEFGLTDSTIAHSIANNTGHIGHEKFASDEYLRQRHVNLEVGTLVERLPENLAMNVMAFRIPSLNLWQQVAIISYDSALFHELDHRLSLAGIESRTPFFETIIPYYIDSVMPACSLEQAESAHDGFHRLYLDRHPDAALESRYANIITRLRASTIGSQRTK